MNTLRIDYHFHPNLPSFSRRLQQKKAKKTWNAFQEHQLDAVIVTEHVYKNPAEAFQTLKNHQKDHTRIFPGVEYLTEENLDIIVFAEHPDIYDYNELLDPYRLDLEQLLDLVDSDDQLYSLLPHPFLPATTGIVNFMGRKSAKDYLDRFNGIEIHNACFCSLLNLLPSFPLKAISNMEKTQNCPAQFFKNADPDFLACGSDSHHLHALGNCALVEKQHDTLFENIVDNEGVEFSNNGYTPPLILKDGLTTFNEFLIKLRFRMRNLFGGR